MTLDSDVARLARTRPFTLLPREAVQLIAFSSKKRRWPAGEVLFRAGEPGDAGYFIHSGIIALVEKSGGPGTGRQVGAGALIGEGALYGPAARRVEARAVEDALATEIEREIFRRVLGEFPEAAEKVRAALAERTLKLVEGLDAARTRSFAVAPAARSSP